MAGRFNVKTRAGATEAELYRELNAQPEARAAGECVGPATAAGLAVTAAIFSRGSDLGRPAD